MKTYKVGIIGFGFIGKVHAYGHLNIPLFYEQQEFQSRITHICTSKLETARKGADQIGAEHAVTDFREITENPDIDIVDICTPNHLHFDAVISAMQHGKHIYCDKPLTSTLDDALKIQEKLQDYRGISQMTLQNRFFPAVMRAKQLIDAGAIGEVLEFRGQYLHSGNADPKAPLKWKLEAGTIADLGSHIIDLMNYLLGDFSELMASTHIAYPERPCPVNPGKKLKVTAEDNMIALVRLPNGACGTIAASKIATGVEDGFSFEIHGSRGALRWEPMNLDKLFFYDCSAASAPLGGIRGWTAIDCGQRYDKPAGFPTPKAPIGWLRGHMHCLYTFLDSVHKRKAAGPTLEQGIKIQKIMETVKESAAKHCWIEL
ncbi:MAG: Gfo/Idh/MocA family oxidoreductase [Lentisphaerae bacterium]|nr:Gfo/Idh/MocA family oxidoreductase [Lentisphaerota bacterium]